MVRRVLAVVALVVVSLLAEGQQNQRMRDRDPDLEASKKLWGDLQQANYHSGPFYWWGRLRLADVGYAESGYLPTGDEEGNLSISVEAPNRFFFVPRKKLIFTVDVNPGYSFFTEGDSNGQWNYLVRGDMHLLLNHLYVDVYASRSDQLRAHVSDFNRLATLKEDEAGVASEFKYSSRTSAFFTVRFIDGSYPEDRYQPDPIPVSVLDRKERNARVSFQHKTFARTALFAAAERSDYEFQNQSAYDSNRQYLGGGFLFDSGRTNVRVEAGRTKLGFDDASQPDFDGWTGSLRANRTNGRWTWYLDGSRDLGFAIFFNNPYFIATNGSIGADYTATRRLTLHARSSHELDEYEQPVEGQYREDRISFSSLGFSYAIGHARVGADAGWYERTSEPFGDDESGIRYLIRLSFNL